MANSGTGQGISAHNTPTTSPAEWSGGKVCSLVPTLGVGTHGGDAPRRGSNTPVSFIGHPGSTSVGSGLGTRSVRRPVPTPSVGTRRRMAWAVSGLLGRGDALQSAHPRPCRNCHPSPGPGLGDAYPPATACRRRRTPRGGVPHGRAGPRQAGHRRVAPEPDQPVLHRDRRQPPGRGGQARVRGDRGQRGERRRPPEPPGPGLRRPPGGRDRPQPVRLEGDRRVDPGGERGRGAGVHRGHRLPRPGGAGGGPHRHRQLRRRPAGGRRHPRGARRPRRQGRRSSTTRRSSPACCG